MNKKNSKDLISRMVGQSIPPKVKKSKGKNEHENSTKQQRRN